MNALLKSGEGLVGYTLDKLILSHSSQSLFHSCERKFEFRKMYGDSRDREDDLSAAVGKAIHFAYGVYLATNDMDKALWELGIKYPYDLYERDRMDPAKKSSALERSLEACYSTVTNMMMSERLSDYEVIYIRGHDGVERPAIEVPFAIRITGSPYPLPVWFVGFIDCILFNKVTQQYIVVDIKSTRRWIKDYSARYEYDAQCLPYGLILEHLLGKKITQFEVAYFAVYIDLLEPKSRLYQFTKTPDLISDWHRTLCDDIDKLTRYTKAQWFPRANSGESCIGFGKECFFREFCHTRDPETVGKLMQGQKQEKLFSTGEEPWVIADLAYEPFERRAA